MDGAEFRQHVFREIGFDLLAWRLARHLHIQNPERVIAAETTQFHDRQPYSSRRT
jgi:hypothetical protein